MSIGLPQTPWRLIRLDPPYEVFTAQYMPEGYTETVSTNWGDLPVPRREDPLLQWIRGEAETVAFTARFFNTGALQVDELLGVSASQLATPDVVQTEGSNALGRDVVRDLAVLRKLVKVDPRLGRPPQWTFEWGREIRFDCVVQSIGGLQIGELWRDGRIRDVTAQIALRKIGAPFNLERIDPSKAPHDSLYRQMQLGGSYEAMAAREYGKPAYGVFLRQRNVAAFPQPGDLVRLPEADRFARMRREPASFALSDDPRARAARLAAIDARTGSRDLPFLT